MTIIGSIPKIKCCHLVCSRTRHPVISQGETIMARVTQYQACGRPIEIVELSGAGDTREHALKDPTKANTRLAAANYGYTWAGRRNEVIPTEADAANTPQGKPWCSIARDLLAGSLQFTLEDVHREAQMRRSDVLVRIRSSMSRRSAQIANGSLTLTPRRHRRSFCVLEPRTSSAPFCGCLLVAGGPQSYHSAFRISSTRNEGPPLSLAKGTCAVW